MPGKLVPTVRTTCTDVELCKAFIIAWRNLFNETPKKESIAVIVGQHNLETGSGNACWNWNLGNIKYVAANGNVDYCALHGVWEIVNGKRVELTSTDPGSWFRSFETLNDGIVFYINFINGKRYHSAWSAIVSGNPAAFAHLLRLQGYYTAPEADYVKGVTAYFNKFMKTTAFETALAELDAAKPVPVEPEPTLAPVEPVTPPVTPEPIPTVITTPEVVVVGKVSIWQTILSFLSKLFKR